MENNERIRFFEGAKLRFLLGAKTLISLFYQFIFGIKDFSVTFVPDLMNRESGF